MAVAQKRSAETKRPDLLQLELSFVGTDCTPFVQGLTRVVISHPLRRGRDPDLENKARGLLRSLGSRRFSQTVRVEWNPRMRTAAGHADLQHARVSLNPRLFEHGEIEIDRTLRHELAHLLAQSRAGRRRILPHGEEWRRACHDLGIGDEPRCHNLPFPINRRAHRYLYRCPNCRADFQRVRRMHRTVACLACCRRYNRGRFDKRFQLRLIETK